MSEIEGELCCLAPMASSRPAETPGLLSHRFADKQLNFTLRRNRLGYFHTFSVPHRSLVRSRSWFVPLIREPTNEWEPGNYLDAAYLLVSIMGICADNCRLIIRSI